MNGITMNDIVTTLVTLSFLLASPARGEDQTPTVGQLAAELRTVQAELLAVRLELETGRVARLESEHTMAVKNGHREAEDKQSDIAKQLHLARRTLTALLERSRQQNTTQ
jgi:hypothetical protein